MANTKMFMNLSGGSNNSECRTAPVGDFEEKKLHVSKVPLDIDEPMFIRLFSQCGKLENARLMHKDGYTHKIGKVKYSTNDGAMKAFQMFNRTSPYKMIIDIDRGNHNNLANTSVNPFSVMSNFTHPYVNNRFAVRADQERYNKMDNNSVFTYQERFSSPENMYSSPENFSSPERYSPPVSNCQAMNTSRLPPFRYAPPEGYSPQLKSTTSFPTTDFISRKFLQNYNNPPPKKSNGNQDKSLAIYKGSIDSWDSKSKKYLVVSLSDVPGLIWAADNSNEVLQEALRITNEFCMKYTPQPASHFTVGSVVAAKQKGIDGYWYRAIVLDKLDSSWRVQDLDFGDITVVDYIGVLPIECCKHPALAVLFTVLRSSDRTWSSNLRSKSCLVASLISSSDFGKTVDIQDDGSRICNAISIWNDVLPSLSKKVTPEKTGFLFDKQGTIKRQQYQVETFISPTSGSIRRDFANIAPKSDQREIMVNSVYQPSQKERFSNSASAFSQNEKFTNSTPTHRNVWVSSSALPVQKEEFNPFALSTQRGHFANPNFSSISYVPRSNVVRGIRFPPPQLNRAETNSKPLKIASHAFKLNEELIVKPTWFSDEDGLYVQLSSEESKKSLDLLFKNMNIVCSKILNDRVSDRMDVYVSQDVCVKWVRDKNWYRSEILKIVSADTVEVRFLDYGHRYFVDTSSMVEILSDFCTLAPLAVAVSVLDLNLNYYQKAIDILEANAATVSWTMRVITPDTRPLGVVMFNSDGMRLADMLHETGKLDVAVKMTSEDLLNKLFRSAEKRMLEGPETIVKLEQNMEESEFGTGTNAKLGNSAVMKNSPKKEEPKMEENGTEPSEAEFLNISHPNETAVWLATDKSPEKSLTCLEPNIGPDKNTAKYKQLGIKRRGVTPRKPITLSDEEPDFKYYYEDVEMETLQVGKTVTVVFTDVQSPHNLYCWGRDGDVIAEQVDSLSELITKTVEKKNVNGPYIPDIGEMCIVKYEDNLWYRAACLNKFAEDCSVRFVDYGNKITVSYAAIKPMQKEFMNLTVQGILCHIEGTTADDCYETEDKKTFLNLIPIGKDVEINVVSTNETDSSYWINIPSVKIADFLPSKKKK